MNRAKWPVFLACGVAQVSQVSNTETVNFQNPKWYLLFRFHLIDELHGEFTNLARILFA